MPESPRRSLLIIGGAEDKVGRVTVLRRFVRLAGGRSSRLVVIPTASSVPDEVVDVYSTIFTRLGAPEVTAVDPPTRQASSDPQIAEQVDGGGQARGGGHAGDAGGRSSGGRAPRPGRTASASSSSQYSTGPPARFTQNTRKPKRAAP